MTKTMTAGQGTALTVNETSSVSDGTDSSTQKIELSVIKSGYSANIGTSGADTLSGTSGSD
ncbi:hypothetical protein V5T82_08145 [Magnetovibrio sp. PR-2]|uniref:hypothetical protein n=1 Tax=Magnetovibrio sp. PR-2 TaxID=3120356 RepID=UPI002FCE5ABF